MKATADCQKPPRSASALVIVLVLLSVIGALVMSNTVALRRLKLELQRLEEKQKRAIDAPTGDPRHAPHQAKE